MKLGEVANAEAAGWGKPLDGVRVLALEQMQAVPYGTQLLARLGADVVKVEPPRGGDSGRSSLPAITDPDGRPLGATFLRNNLNKRSIAIDLKDPRGRELLLALAPRFDIVAENFKPGVMARLGLDYADIVTVHPAVIYVSVSGFGASGSPYTAWPAYASVAEAMSGIYELKRLDGEPPTISPVGALGDISAALFATVGVLAALRQRDRTGQGQRVDIAMLDAVMAMTDIVTNLWSLGLRKPNLGPLIMTGFEASDGWFMLQVGREHHFAVLAEKVGHPEWVGDPRFATRQGWVDHLDSDIRPAINEWAAGMTKLEASTLLGEAGLPSGPCFSEEEVVHDPHVASRAMLVEMERPSGEGPPVLIPGNPVKLSKVAEGPERRVPWLGEHTDELLEQELGLSPERIAELRTGGVVA